MPLVVDLVQNGVRHNVGPGGAVAVGTRADPERAVLEVSNTGAPLHPRVNPTSGLIATVSLPGAGRFVPQLQPSATSVRHAGA